MKNNLMGSKSKNLKRFNWKRFIIKLFITGFLFIGITLFSFVILIKLGVFGELPTYADLKKIKNNKFSKEIRNFCSSSLIGIATFINYILSIKQSINSLKK